MCTDKIKALQEVSTAIMADLILTHKDPEDDFHPNPLLWQAKHPPLQTDAGLQPFAGRDEASLPLCSV